MKSLTEASLSHVADDRRDDIDIELDGLALEFYVSTTCISSPIPNPATLSTYSSKHQGPLHILIHSISNHTVNFNKIKRSSGVGERKR